LYIADTGNNTVRKVDTNGIITTVAGQWIQNPLPNPIGAAIPSCPAAQGCWIGVNGPAFVAINNSGYTRQTTNEPSGDGGPGTSAYRNGPRGIALDSTGTKLYIADTGNHAVREVNLNPGIIRLVAGGYPDGSSDGAPGGLPVPAGS